MYRRIKNPCISNLTDFLFLLGNYHESLNDAKAAVELQPHYIKAIARGKVCWHSVCSLYWYLHREKKNIEKGDLNNGLRKQLTFVDYLNFVCAHPTYTKSLLCQSFEEAKSKLI